ncbi:hypothetical protein KIPB_009760 [Kipferlia bialata]|uniref:Uncharacterized protein n=1 Tax=Kipferlia bialata TaxID=797122 RepID=A0A391NY76_9EUKA|nr:hypothetical protein KIPB_009760 [Kipferlia bialata]|eukprot:g9760.t1
MGYHGVLVCFRGGATPDLPWVEVADVYMCMTSLYDIRHQVQRQFPWLRLVKPMEIWRTVYPTYPACNKEEVPSSMYPIGFELEGYPHEWMRLGSEGMKKYSLIHEYHPKELGPDASSLRKAVLVLPLSQVV